MCVLGSVVQCVGAFVYHCGPFPSHTHITPSSLTSPLQGRTRPQLDADVDLAELAGDKFCAGFS